MLVLFRKSATNSSVNFGITKDCVLCKNICAKLAW